MITINPDGETGESVVAIRVDDATTLLLERASEVLERARKRVIASDADYREAGAELREVKSLEKGIDGAKFRLKLPLADATKRIDAIFFEPAKTVGEAERVLKKTMAAYVDGRERARREEAERIRAEREREKREAEEARKRDEETAAKLEGFGPTHHVAVAPKRSSAFGPSTTVPKADGISTRKVRKARVVDKIALLRAAADGDPLALAVIDIDLGKLATLATTHKGQLGMPGVEFFDDLVVVARP